MSLRLERVSIADGRAPVIREFLKTGIEKGLAHTGVLQLARRLRPVDTVILAYHNIVPEGCSTLGERSLHLPQPDFSRQLDVLLETCDVVGLEHIAGPRLYVERPRAVITFDDAYHGAVTVGLPEVIRRGLTATVFVSPGYVGGHTFWWDELADPNTAVLSAEVRERMIRHRVGKRGPGSECSRDGFESAVEVPPYARTASVEDIGSAVNQPGISIASHTFSHADLTRLPNAEIHRELSESLSWLRERFDNVIPWLSYPYGLTSRRVQSVAAAAGYQGAVLVNGGVVRDRQKLDLYAVPRANVPAGLSLEGFELRIAGLRAS